MHYHIVLIIQSVPSINCSDSVQEQEHYELSRNDYLLVVLWKMELRCLSAELINLFLFVRMPSSDGGGDILPATNTLTTSY